MTHSALHGDVWALGRAMAVDFNSQLRLRFRHLAGFHVQWAGLVRPALNVAKQKAFF